MTRRTPLEKMNQAVILHATERLDAVVIRDAGTFEQRLTAAAFWRLFTPEAREDRMNDELAVRRRILPPRDLVNLAEHRTVTRG